MYAIPFKTFHHILIQLNGLIQNFPSVPSTLKKIYKSMLTGSIRLAGAETLTVYTEQTDVTATAGQGWCWHGFRVLLPTAVLHLMDGQDAGRNQLKKTLPNSYCLWVSTDLRWGGSRAPLLLNPSLPLWDPPVNCDGPLISLYNGLSTLFYTTQLSSKMETEGDILLFVSTLAPCDCHTHPFTVFLGHKLEDTQIPRSQLWPQIAHLTSLNPEFYHPFPHFMWPVPFLTNQDLATMHIINYMI